MNNLNLYQMKQQTETETEKRNGNVTESELS